MPGSKVDPLPSEFKRFKSPMDLLHQILPLDDFSESVVLGGILYSAIVLLALGFQEFSTLIIDYATPIIVFGIGSMVYLETRIGDYIRSTATALEKDFQFKCDPMMNKIFCQKLRFGVGIASVMICALGFLGLPVLNVLWYQSPVLRTYLIGLVLFLVFIAGEAVTGAVTVVIASHDIADGLRQIIDPLSFERFVVVRRVAMWGVLLSGYGSAVASVLLVGIFVAPWRTGSVNVQTATLVLLTFSSALAVFLFLTPVMNIHGLLMRSKQKSFFMISSNLEKVYSRFKMISDRGDVAQTQAEADLIGKMLDDIEAARKAADSAPEWPWDLPMVHSFTISFALPLIIYLLERLLAPNPILK